MKNVITDVAALLETKPKQTLAVKLAGQKMVVERLKGVVSDLKRTSNGLEASVMNLDPVVQHGGKTVNELITALRHLQKMVELQSDVVGGYIDRFEKIVDQNTAKAAKEK